MGPSVQLDVGREGREGRFVLNLCLSHPVVKRGEGIEGEET